MISVWNELRVARTERPHPELEYHPAFYGEEQGRQLLQSLCTQVTWQTDHFMAFGRRIEIPRLQAWYADPGIRYSYSNNLLQTLAWLPELTALREQIELACGHRFNSVLLTYYRDGRDSVSWHADDEQELGPEPWIASLSLGASRVMQYRNKHQSETGELPLHHGDLLLMRPGFQQHWLHQVAAQPEVDEPRINLTYRLVAMDDSG